jgi:hypothetical protein
MARTVSRILMMDDSLARGKHEFQCNSDPDWRSTPALCLVVLVVLQLVPASSGKSTQASNPERVSICQLRADPARYNHKSVEVTGFFSHGFENFTLLDPECRSRNSIWLEYGGRVSSRTIYCCPGSPERTRPKPLVVENIKVPLVDDERFRAFDELIQRRPDAVVHATVVGRFFSGRQQRDQDGALWEGYGHMGCCSLLAIEQVIVVDPQDRDDLDYGASADHPDDLNVGCSYRALAIPLPPVEAQKKGESGEQAWSFTDPKRVATETLARLLDREDKSIAGITQTRQAQGRTVYRWQHPDNDKSYMIVVSRPYWLSFYAEDPRKVAWVVIATYESSCR